MTLGAVPSGPGSVRPSVSRHKNTEGIRLMHVDDLDEAFNVINSWLHSPSTPRAVCSSPRRPKLFTMEIIFTMSENVDRLVVKISQTLDTSGERSQGTISVMDVWIELQMGRHLPTEKGRRDRPRYYGPRDQQSSRSNKDGIDTWVHLSKRRPVPLPLSSRLPSIPLLRSADGS